MLNCCAFESRNLRRRQPVLNHLKLLLFITRILSKVNDLPMSSVVNVFVWML